MTTTQQSLVKPGLIHLPLEPYKQRYTEFLSGWERKAFSAQHTVRTIAPAQETMNIQSGRVLDSLQRPLWCLHQMQELLNTPSNRLGNVYFSDFYTSGLDALAYSQKSFQAWSFCWAQTFDQYDFTRAMVPWMRPYEHMAFDIYSGVFVAHPLLADLICTAMPHVANKVHVVGLPFDSETVEIAAATSQEGIGEIDCVYSSRWDTEKNPGMFLDLVDACRGMNLTFAVCTGWDELRGTDTQSINRARRMEQMGELVIKRNLTKADYYRALTQAHVQFNCASQDWISFTLLEGLAAGCFPLYPMTRSFSDTLEHDSAFLYAPGNVNDAKEHLENLLGTTRTKDGGLAHRVLDYHNGTLRRISQTMYNNG